MLDNVKVFQLACFFFFLFQESAWLLWSGVPANWYDEDSV